VATEQQHLDRARSNESFAKTLSPLSHADWKIIICFYAALHYVEAVVVRSGHRSSDHGTRATYLRQIPALRPVSTDYFTLSNWAWKARYDPTIDLSAQKNVQDICDLLEAIRKGLGF
jgi:hypothetical protein